MKLTIGKRIIVLVSVVMALFVLTYLLVELMIFLPLGSAENMTPDKVALILSKSQKMIFSLFLISIITSIALSILTIRKIAMQLSEFADKLTSTAQDVSSASMQLSSASSSLAESSNQQASSIEETSASLEEMTGMVEKNVENAEKSNAINDEVQTMAQQGNGAMINLIQSMKEIEKSNENIQVLVKVIGEIGEKTAVIDEIVFQTKLLSFNASVEAERAGEHGRGFAVVAQEVGNLAQMSGKAALEIANIVKESIRSAEAITADNKSKVDKGSQLVKEAADTLANINRKARDVANFSSQIFQASKEQSMGIRQINEAVVQLDKVTQGNAAISEEQAMSSSELRDQAGSLNIVVQELRNLINGGVTIKTTPAKQSKIAAPVKKAAPPAKAPVKKVAPSKAPVKKVETKKAPPAPPKVVKKKSAPKVALKTEEKKVHIKAAEAKDQMMTPTRSEKKAVAEPVIKDIGLTSDLAKDNNDAWEKL